MPYLTNEDKLAIVTQRIKNAESNQYNLQLNIREINVTALPDTNAIARLNSQITDLAAEISMLNGERDNVQAAIDAANSSQTSNS